MADETTSTTETTATDATSTTETKAAETTTQTETKAAETTATKSTETETKAAETKAADAKPIEYGEFAAPEGMKLDGEALKGVTPLFQELKLTQEQAQKLVTFYAGQVKATTDANAKAWADTIKGWQSELKADAEFGGAKLEETTSLAAKAIDAYGGADAPAIREFMKTYGLGDHPAFARFLARAGRSVREDSLPRGEGARPNGDARSMFPNSNMNP